MKKILSVLLLVAMMASCVLPTVISAEPGELTMSLVGPAEILDNAETVELKLNLDGNSESGVWGMSVFLAYTPGWTIASVNAGNLWAENEIDVALEPAAYAYEKLLGLAGINAEEVNVAVIQLVCDDDAMTNKITEDGTIVSVVFNVPADVAEGDSLDVAVLYDPDDPMTFDEDGEVVDVVFASVNSYSANVVGLPTAAFENVTAKTGDEVEVNLNLTGMKGVKSVDVANLTYDTENLTLVSAEWNLDADNTWDDNGGSAVFAENADIENGAALTLTFKVADEAEETVYAVSADVVVKTDADTAMEIAYVPGSVTVANVVRGDFDGNGEVESDDAIYLLYNTMMGDEAYPLNQSGDIDGNGEVESDDAIYLLYYTMMGDEAYPLH